MPVFSLSLICYMLMKMTKMRNIGGFKTLGYSPNPHPKSSKFDPRLPSEFEILEKEKEIEKYKKGNLSVLMMMMKTRRR